MLGILTGVVLVYLCARVKDLQSRVSDIEEELDDVDTDSE